MTTNTDVANAAFTLLGHPRVTNVTDETTDAAIAFNAHFDIARLEMLEASAWQFAKTSAILNAITGATPGIDFTAVYQLPSSPKCLTVLKTNLDKYSAWSRYGDTLHANQQPTIEYVQDVSIDTFTATAVSAIVYLLASRLAIPLGGSGTTEERYYAKYERVLAEARQSNEHQRGKRDTSEGSLKIARYTRGSNSSTI